VDGRRHGHGTFTSAPPSPVTYTGEWRHGLRHGKVRGLAACARGPVGRGGLAAGRDARAPAASWGLCPVRARAPRVCVVCAQGTLTYTSDGSCYYEVPPCALLAVCLACRVPCCRVPCLPCALRVRLVPVRCSVPTARATASCAVFWVRGMSASTQGYPSVAASERCPRSRAPLPQGDFVDGKRHGQGTVVYPSGNWYGSCRPPSLHLAFVSCCWLCAAGDRIAVAPALPRVLRGALWGAGRVSEGCCSPAHLLRTLASVFVSTVSRL
jgi:hypothetical protein